MIGDLECSKTIHLIWYALKKNSNMFRLTLSRVGKRPVKIFKFRLGSYAAGKFPVGPRDFAQHWSSRCDWATTKDSGATKGTSDMGNFRKSITE